MGLAMDLTPLIVFSIILTVFIMSILYRTIIVINPGQEGLLYILGRYRRTLRPGLWFVHPLSQVIKVASGQQIQIQPGALGVVDVTVEAEGFEGRVRIGETIVAARSSGTLSPGTKVRVVSAPRSIQVVDVERERP